MRCTNCSGDHFISAEYVMRAAGRRLVLPQCVSCGVFAFGDTSQASLGEEERGAIRRAAMSALTWRPPRLVARELRTP